MLSLLYLKIGLGLLISSILGIGLGVFSELR